MRATHSGQCGLARYSHAHRGFQSERTNLIVDAKIGKLVDTDITEELLAEHRGELLEAMVNMGKDKSDQPCAATGASHFQ